MEILAWPRLVPHRLEAVRQAGCTISLMRSTKIRVSLDWLTRRNCKIIREGPNGRHDQKVSARNRARRHVCDYGDRKRYGSAIRRYRGQRASSRREGGRAGQTSVDDPPVQDRLDARRRVSAEVENI